MNRDGLGGKIPAEAWQAILANGAPRSFSSGQNLVRQGEPGRHILALTTGLVKVTRVESDGRELVLAVRCRGEIIGEFSYLDSEARSATVTAISDCHTYLMPAERFRRIVSQFHIGDTVLRHITARLRESEDIRSELTSLPSRRRIARMLLRFSVDERCALSQEDIAKAVGLSRSAVAAELAWLRGRGLVSTGRGRVTITDLARLSDLAKGQTGQLPVVCVQSWTERNQPARHCRRRDPPSLPEALMPANASRPLPPYRGLIAVDTERFTGNPSAYQPDLSAAVPEVLQEALKRSGHIKTWERRRFPQGTGDGYLFGVVPEELPFLLTPFLGALHETLAGKDESLRSLRRDLRLRLRVSINVGPVHDSGDPQRDRIGEPTNTTCRLLDSTPVKEALKQSDPDVTLMAAIVSQRVFDDVIRAGYTPALGPSQFKPVTADVPGKDFTEPAWLYLPLPSHLASDTRQSSGDASGTAQRPPQRPAAGSRTYTQSGSNSQQINAEHIGHINYRGTNS